MLSVIHLTAPAEHTEFAAEAHALLAILHARPGFTWGRLARATDDDHAWVLVTEWQSVGAYRRALGHYDVKMMTPFMAFVEDRPSAFEPLASAVAGEQLSLSTSDRAPDADNTPRSH